MRRDALYRGPPISIPTNTPSRSARITCQATDATCGRARQAGQQQTTKGAMPGTASAVAMTQPLCASRACMWQDIASARGGGAPAASPTSVLCSTPPSAAPADGHRATRRHNTSGAWRKPRAWRLLTRAKGGRRPLPRHARGGGTGYSIGMNNSTPRQNSLCIPAA